MKGDFKGSNSFHQAGEKSNTSSHIIRLQDSLEYNFNFLKMMLISIQIQPIQMCNGITFVKHFQFLKSDQKWQSYTLFIENHEK